MSPDITRCYDMSKNVNKKNFSIVEINVNEDIINNM